MTPSMTGGSTCMAEVLAKNSPTVTLARHTEDCLRVFSSVRRLFPHLPRICGEPNFFRHLFYALYLHDLGKAAAGFQAMLRGGPAWGYRHEILSAGYINSLAALNDDEKSGVAMAILTHHKGIAALRERFNTTSAAGRENFACRVAELAENFAFTRDFLLALPRFASNYLNYSLPEPQPPQSLSEICDAYQFIIRYLRQIDEGELTNLHSTYGVMLRGMVVACDHLASSGQASVCGGLDGGRIEKAIRKALESRAETLLSSAPPGDLSVSRREPKTVYLYRPRQTANLRPGSALLSAAFNSGKTIATLLWAAINQDGGRRIFYVLPYTAGVNAMSRRLSAYFGEDAVGALHSKVGYFAYREMCERRYGPDEASDFAREAEGLTKKIYRPLKVLTPFQILKPFFGVRGWEAQFAEMSDGLFIFDEIQAYDARLTALILSAVKRLAALGARFLFLSSTAPRFLRELIRGVLPGIGGINTDENDAVNGHMPDEPRRRIEMLEGEIFDHVRAIRRELKRGRRVLVVCNTVKRTQGIYCALRGAARSALLLHCRFILRDRERIERRLGGAELLVGSRTVEAELDADFDLLYTEPAPIDALVRRFGRLSRKDEPGTAVMRVCKVGSDKDKYFYDADRTKRTLDVLAGGKSLTERQVASMVEQVYTGGYNSREQAVFDRVSSSFARVIDNLYPFDEAEDKDLFNKLVRSVEVIPGRAIESLYLASRNEGRSLESAGYYCDLTLGQKAKLEKLECIERRVDNHGEPYWFVDAKYDEEIGLVIDEKESEAVFID